MQDRISIVMITRNRGAQIHTAVRHLLALPEKPHIIVVDNGSSDDTVNIARGLDREIEVVSLGRNLGGAGRNVGVSLARTAYVAFSDDDSWWAPGALSRACDLLDSDPRLGLLAARILVGPDEQLDPICELMSTNPLASDGHDGHSPVGVPITSFVACGAVVRKLAFLQAGGFDPHFGVGGEEEVLSLDLLRRGWRLAYSDDVTAYHHPSQVRNVARRQRHQVRNALWSAWLRRPVPAAVAATRRFAACALRDNACRSGLLAAFVGLPWVLSARHPVPDHIDRQVQISESSFYSSQ